jgi:hypothetical protein
MVADSNAAALDVSSVIYRKATTSKSSVFAVLLPEFIADPSLIATVGR